MDKIIEQTTSKVANLVYVANDGTPHKTTAAVAKRNAAIMEQKISKNKIDLIKKKNQI